MKTVTFDWLLNELSYQREMRCINANEDVLNVIGGNEGSGKSVLGMAMCMIDPDFSAQNIYYFWKDFLQANMNTIKLLAKNLTKEEFEKYNEYGIKLEDVTVIEGCTHKPGDCLLYDESGTQMFNRSAMTKQNSQQVKLFIANRFLRLIYFLCVPKVRSLDKYIREERLKFLFWVHKENSPDMVTCKRYCYVWSRQSFNNMTKIHNWFKMFDSCSNIESLYPDFKILIPNLLDGKYIPEIILKEYNAKKILFNLRQTIDMSSTDTDSFVKPKKDWSLMKPLDGEDCWAWSARTGRSPNAFKSWCKLAG
jgi:hypothetical protein